MVGLDDLDVARLAHRSGCDLNEPEAQIHAHAHVRCQHHGDVPCGLFDLRPLLRFKAGGADHDAPAALPAPFHVAQRGLRQRKIDDHIRFPGQLRGRRHSQGRQARDLSGVGADQLAALALSGRHQPHVVAALEGLHQCLAHAAIDAGYSDADHGIVSPRSHQQFVCQSSHGALGGGILKTFRSSCGSTGTFGDHGRHGPGRLVAGTP